MDPYEKYGYQIKWDDWGLRIARLMTFHDWCRLWVLQIGPLKLIYKYRMEDIDWKNT